MNLIEQRPKTWNAVIGQERALRVLQAALKSEKLMLRGFIFSGVIGVGKTTTAYLTSRALMCTGNDPLGCGRCPSCQTVDRDGIDAHPDFREVDAPKCSGVEQARILLTEVESFPVLGKRKVAMIDEAHALSPDAWRVFLKPLEAPTTDSKFIYVTTDETKIPENIKSRCCALEFGLIPTDLILGMLAQLAMENKIQYELDALKLLAAKARGRARFAANYLGRVAAHGIVTKEIVLHVLDLVLEELSIKLLLAVANKDRGKAVELSDQLAQTNSPAKIIETLFATYGRLIFDDTPEGEILRHGTPDMSLMTNHFIKWSATPNIPLDALPLFIYEMFLADTTERSNLTPSVFASAKRRKGILQPNELVAMLGSARLDRP